MTLGGAISCCKGLEGDTTKTKSSPAWGEGRGNGLTASAGASLDFRWMTYQVASDATTVDESMDVFIRGRSWSSKKEDRETEI